MPRFVKRENAETLPQSYYFRLKEAGITQQAVAQAARGPHPERRAVTAQHINAVLLGKTSCSKTGWLRGLLDDLLMEAKTRVVEGGTPPRGRRGNQSKPPALSSEQVIAERKGEGR